MGGARRSAGTPGKRVSLAVSMDQDEQMELYELQQRVGIRSRTEMVRYALKKLLKELQAEEERNERQR